MSDILLYITLLLVVAIALFISHKIPTGPSVCPNCKKEYQQAEEWSYTEYMWGLRCPHCKYEFDITP
jgi:ssDNA-binding Zn-finger/Zn-ribbon topoisomerase 1